MLQEMSVESEKSVDELQRRALQIPFQEVPWSLLNQLGISLLVRRDDLIDRYQSGNKLYKLFYNLEAAKRAGCRQVLSFGGAYSNHLYALAAAGYESGISTIGVVRGERPVRLSPTLQDAEAWGMRLWFVSRDVYNHKTDEVFLAGLRETFGDFHAIPEGGNNTLGAQGARVIGWAVEQELQGDYTCVCVPCGTGTTLAGIAAGLPKTKLALGFSVLKGEGSLGATIAGVYRDCLGPAADASSTEEGHPANWRLITGYHAGGYARKLPASLQKFWALFEAETGLLLDPVYSLKMFWGIANLATQGYWPKGARIVVAHTGGLQGRRGFHQQYPVIAPVR